MHHFNYINGVLHVENVDIRTIVKAAGSPVYIYSSATIERHFTIFAKAVGAPKNRVFYATKANANIGVLSTLAKLGAGADVVSEGEIRKAQAAGINPNNMVFSGVGKIARELAYAVDAGIYQINVESEGELELLSQVAAARGKRQEIVLRVNPDVGAGGHAKITTGSSANKFGVSFSEAERLYAKASNLAGVRCVGLAVHIGSQITELSALEAAFTKMRSVVESLRSQGLHVERLDLGGGLGIPYEQQAPFVHGPDLIEAYAAMVMRVTDGLDVELGFEPGRLIVGNAGILVTEALYLNKRGDKNFMVVDAAMNDLVRPAMYEAYHEIWPVIEPVSAERIAYDVVGPVCESGDTFTTDRSLPKTEQGDLIAFMSAGAYGATMSSTYNQRPLIAEVMVKGDQFAITRPRQTYEDLIGTDVKPNWV
jgi:diaminopimelate decarboxylase